MLVFVAISVADTQFWWTNDHVRFVQRMRQSMEGNCNYTVTGFQL